jgi:excisionase family DNA binding protein
MVKKAVQPTELTTAEVAQHLGITRRSVIGLIQRGRFPNARKLPAANATYLIPLSDLENYLPVREARKRNKSASSPQTD